MGLQRGSTEDTLMNKSSIFLAVIFIFLSFFLLKGLYNDPKKIESPLIGKEFPRFKLNDLYLNIAHSNDSFLDKKTIINEEKLLYVYEYL